MPSKKVYFYIPGAESLNVLYFLRERYGSNLTVITPSISVAEICEIVGLTHIYPEFYSQSGQNHALSSFWRRMNACRSLMTVLWKLQDLARMILVMFRARTQVALMSEDCTLYYSTFFYDVPGIIFLGSAMRKKNISVKLVWPSHVRFNETIRPPVISETSVLNILTSNLFTHHQHPTAGRIIGINPDYLHRRKITFVDDDFITESELPAPYKAAAFSSLNIRIANRPRVIFLGEYSVEHGVATYGEIYLSVLDLLGKIDGVDVFYKPHPLYHSIIHPSLNGLTVLDTQIPVEFLDDGSWSYIVAFFTASLFTKKLSKCVCLLRLEELEAVALNLTESLRLMGKSNNQITYPTSLSCLEALLRGTNMSSSERTVEIDS